MEEERYRYDSAESVEEKYRWDLESCLLGKSIDEYLERFKELSEEVIALKEKRFENKDLYLKSMKLFEEQTKNISIPLLYLHNKKNTNIVDPETNSELQRVFNIYNNFSARYGSDSYLFKRHKKKLRE